VNKVAVVSASHHTESPMLKVGYDLSKCVKVACRRTNEDRVDDKGGKVFSLHFAHRVPTRSNRSTKFDQTQLCGARLEAMLYSLHTSTELTACKPIPKRFKDIPPSKRQAQTWSQAARRTARHEMAQHTHIGGALKHACGRVGVTSLAPKSHFPVPKLSGKTRFEATR